MKPWLTVLLGLALPAIIGCRTDPAIPLLERELYRKEREINRLQWQIEDLQDLLNSGDERCVTRDRGSDDGQPAASKRGRLDRDVPPPPTSDMPGKGSSKMPDWMNKPRGSGPRGDRDMRDTSPAPTPDRSSNDGPALEGDSGRFSSYRNTDSTPAALAASAVAFNPSGDSRRVAAIEVDKTLTGGINSGDRAGDQGLLVVVEPHDRAGRPIDAPAEVNVAVLDPAMKGEAARVARWDFTAAETASLFRRTNSGGAMHLAMAWPKDPPKHNKLHLFVRYMTADGRRLESNQPIEIALPGDPPARWMAAEPSRPVDPPLERDAAPGSWRMSEGPPPSRTSNPPPYMATRTSESRPERPVWSPERR
jgi:hypothetical protein